jgi:hypothetical protein
VSLGERVGPDPPSPRKTVDSRNAFERSAGALQ